MFGQLLRRLPLPQTPPPSHLTERLPVEVASMFNRRWVGLQRVNRSNHFRHAPSRHSHCTVTAPLCGQSVALQYVFAPQYSDGDSECELYKCLLMRGFGFERETILKKVQTIGNDCV